MENVRSNLGDMFSATICCAVSLAGDKVWEPSGDAHRDEDFTGGCDGDNDDDVVSKQADCHLCDHGKMKNVKIMLMMKQCGGGTERHTSGQAEITGAFTLVINRFISEPNSAACDDEAGMDRLRQ